MLELTYQIKVGFNEYEMKVWLQDMEHLVEFKNQLNEQNKPFNCWYCKKVKML